MSINRHMEHQPDRRPESTLAPGSPVAQAADQFGRLLHDMNSLLDGSMRQLGLALRTCDDPRRLLSEQQDIHRRLSSVKTALEQLTNLVASVGRQSGNPQRAGRIPLPQNLTVADAVEAAAAMLEAPAARSGISLIRRVDPSAAAAPAGPVFPVLLNGIKNAVEAMAAARRVGSIEIIARCERSSADDFAVIEIVDEGPGLAPSLRGRDVFTAGNTSKAGSLGLGLAISREIISELHGTIALLARRDASGMTLRLSYPLQSLATEGAPAPSQDAPSPKRSAA